jgi:DUF1009 family protein
VAGRLSFIAGAGALVPEVIAAARAAGYDLQLLSLQRRRFLFGMPAIPIDLSRPEEVLATLRNFAPGCVVMAGALRLSDRTRETLLRFMGSDGASLGDTGLSGFGSFLTAATGARLVGVHEIAPALVAQEGLLAGPAPAAALREIGAFALALARRTGRLDLGQGVVVAGRRPVAAEDIAGTDALLKRVALYRRFGLAADGRSPLVLAKAAKPDQPHAVDLPAIGPRTIANAKKAGIAMIVVQAGATLVIERAKLAAAAARLRLPVLALPAHDD